MNRINPMPSTLPAVFPEVIRFEEITARHFRRTSIIFREYMKFDQRRFSINSDWTGACTTKFDKGVCGWMEV